MDRERFRGFSEFQKPVDLDGRRIGELHKHRQFAAEHFYEAAHRANVTIGSMLEP